MMSPMKDIILYTTMPEAQETCYREFDLRTGRTDVYNDDGSIDTTKSCHKKLNKLMELRLIIGHPFLSHEKEEYYESLTNQDNFLKKLVECSGKLKLLDRLLKELKSRGHKVIIVSSMIRMMNLVEQYLKLSDYKYDRIDSTIPRDTREQRIDKFRNPDEDIFCFLISSRSSLHVDLSIADTMIMYESESPPMESALTALIHRVEQVKPVRIFRLMSLGTLERDYSSKIGMLYQSVSGGVFSESTRSELTRLLNQRFEANHETVSDHELKLLLDRNAWHPEKGQGFEVVNVIN